jgi:hypothetical protein
MEVEISFHVLIYEYMKDYGTSKARGYTYINTYRNK